MADPNTDLMLDETTQQAAAESIRTEAWAAAGSGDWDAAATAWAKLRADFPDALDGYTEGFDALCQAGRPQEAEAVTATGLRQLPGAPEVWHRHALAAFERDDYGEAAQRWHEMCERFPDIAQGYHLTMMALRLAERVEEAERLAPIAVAQFETDPDVWTEYILLAVHKDDWPEAADRAEQMREAVPGHPAGYRFGVLALREAGRLDEAEQIGEAGLQAAPNSFDLLREHALTAQHRGDQAETVRRWAVIRERFPDDRESYVGSVAALRNLARFDEVESRTRAADDLAHSGLEVCPDHYGLWREYALTALHARHWPEAARRWNEVRTRFPDRPEPYQNSAMALTLAGDTAEAEQVIRQGLQRFEDDPGLWADHAQLAVYRNDPAEAVQRWEQVRQRFPGRPDGYQRAIIALHQLGRFAEADTIALAALDRFPSDGPMHLLMRFESLGDNGEFGLVQRHFGAEPPGLLRWAEIAPVALAKALHERFAGTGEPGNVEVSHPNADLSVVQDKVYGFVTESFLTRRDGPDDVFLRLNCQRMQFLKEQLIGDLEAGRKIFVYKPRNGLMSDAEIDIIHAGIRRFGTAPLLCVRIGDDPAMDGTVEKLADGLMVGYIRTVSPDARGHEILYASWLRLCTEAAALAAEP